MTKKALFFCLFTAVLLSSCTGNNSTTSAEGGDTLQLKYAGHISIVKFKDYAKVDLVDPWKEGRILHSYLLIPKSGKVPGKLPEGTVVRTPIQRSIVFTAAHCRLLEYLHRLDNIAGVADLKYINIPEIKRRAEQGRITDCGQSASPAIEKVMELNPDALILSPFENSGSYGKLGNLSVAIIEAADYMEVSPLARAEWMKFFGMLYGAEKEADSLFNVVETHYNRLKEEASLLPKGLSILTERKTASVWYCPGGKSTIGQLAADANGKYAFAEDNHSGSLPLSFEQVLEKAGNTDVWAFKISTDKLMSRQDLLDEYRGYKSLKAFKTGNIYQCKVNETQYFEDSPFRPDYLLNDFILMLHPEAKGKLRFYTK